MENLLYIFTSTDQFCGCCKLISDDSHQIRTATLDLQKRHLHKLETDTFKGLRVVASARSSHRDCQRGDRWGW